VDNKIMCTLSIDVLYDQICWNEVSYLHNSTKWYSCKIKTCVYYCNNISCSSSVLCCALFTYFVTCVDAIGKP
jgi:hypothetical protein